MRQRDLVQRSALYTQEGEEMRHMAEEHQGDEAEGQKDDKIIINNLIDLEKK